VLDGEQKYKNLKLILFFFLYIETHRSFEKNVLLPSLANGETAIFGYVKKRKKERKRKEEGEDAILSYCFIYIKWL
jgi:hypothetical protein